MFESKFGKSGFLIIEGDVLFDGVFLFFLRLFLTRLGFEMIFQVLFFDQAALALIRIAGIQKLVFDAMVSLMPEPSRRVSTV